MIYIWVLYSTRSLQIHVICTCCLFYIRNNACKITHFEIEKFNWVFSRLIKLIKITNIMHYNSQNMIKTYLHVVTLCVSVYNQILLYIYTILSYHMAVAHINQ